MADSYHISFLPSNIPISLQLITGVLLLALVFYVYSTLASERPYAGYPVVALTEKGLGPKASWLRKGRETLIKGIQQYGGAPFQIMTGTGPKIVLPNRFADELRNLEQLSFVEAFSKEFFTEFPGFEGPRQGLQDDNLLQETIRVKLTQSLGLITNDLVEETTLSLHDIFGEDKEWHVANVKQYVMEMIPRLTSRVFLGRELCRNARWLAIARDYTMDVFIGSRLLRAVPATLRPIVHWVMPHCIRLRREYRDASRLIMPEIERRTKRAHEALAAGKKPPKTADTIGWMYEIASKSGRKVDYVGAQLSLTLAAIHTTSEALTTIIMDLADHPEFVQPLREEVIEVIGKEGWSKTALYKLKLMDSFMKESQRMHPPGFTSMNRYVTTEIQLSDGTILPAGASIMVANRYADPTIYPDPSKFDAARFLRMREQPGQQNAWQHVTTSAQHFGFGHGTHACPGRFFASNELKIALAHLLLKYDWRYVDGKAPPMLEFEAAVLTPRNLMMEIRRRQEEIDLDVSLAETTDE